MTNGVDRVDLVGIGDDGFFYVLGYLYVCSPHEVCRSS